MKGNTFARFRAIWMSMLIFCFTVASLSAEEFGLFTYQVIGGTTIQITDYPTTEAGHVDIPTEIDGKPVTSIGNSAFAYCTGLTSITIAEGVTYIGWFAFSDCSGLTSVTIPSSINGIV